MPKEGMRWILCWVFLFYNYYPGCQDAKVLDAAAIYMGLMNLFAQTCILLLFPFTTGTCGWGAEKSAPPSFNILKITTL